MHGISVVVSKAFMVCVFGVFRILFFNSPFALGKYYDGGQSYEDAEKFKPVVDFDNSSYPECALDPSIQVSIIFVQTRNVLDSFRASAGWFSMESKIGQTCMRRFALLTPLRNFDAERLIDLNYDSRTLPLGTS
jgi:hypothetical protein